MAISAAAPTHRGISAQHLSRRFGPIRALVDVDLDVPTGGVTVLLGPNGAGKTTLLSILAGLSRPDSGSATVAGLDLAGAQASARREIGLVTHRPLVYPELTAEENLRFHARLYAMPDRRARIQAALDGVDLLRHRHRRVREFSRGMQQRLAIARATLHEPEVLLLDEPFSGLDPAAADRLSDLLAVAAARGCAVLVTSHDLDRTRRIAKRLVIMQRGRIVWRGAIDHPDAADLNALYRRWTRGERHGAASAGARSEAPPAGASGAIGSTAGEIQPSSVETASAASDRHPGIAGAALSLAWKDLRVELRAREIVPPVLLFALLVTVIFQFSLPREPSGVVSGAAGALWSALLLGSTLGLSRAMGGEQDSGGMTGLLMAPIDRGSLFLGKWLSGFILGLLVALGLLPAGVVWLGIPVAHLPALAGIVALGLVGWIAAGTLLAAMAVSTRAREVLLPVLLFPVVLPLILPAVQATAMLLGPRVGDGPDLVSPLMLVAAFDVIFLVLGFLLLPLVVETQA